MNQIYGIVDPETCKIVYVGVSANARLRVRDHWKHRNATERTPVRDWLQSLGSRGVLTKPPDFFVFEEVADDIRFQAECYYTRILREMGIGLLNIVDGQIPRRETRVKTSKTLTGRPSVLRGRTLSLETRKKISDAWKRRKELRNGGDIICLR